MTSIQIDRTDGLSSSVAIKGPCRVASTANVTLSGEQTIDGVAVVTDDRVLVKDQTAPSENGIYVVDTGSWRRAKDFSRTNDVRKGTRVAVTDGTAAGNTVWVCSSTNPIVVGTDAITISSESGDAATVAGVTPGAAGLAILADATVSDVRDYLDVTVYVSTRTALKALDTTKDTSAILTESGREGNFVWRSGNYATQITADTAEGVYLKADAIASTAGAWVREAAANNSLWLAAWFGAVGDDSTANSTQLAAAIATFPSGGGVLLLGDGTFRLTTLAINKPVVLQGLGSQGATTIKSTVLTSDVLTVTSDGAAVKDIRFDATGNRTTGAYIFASGISRSHFERLYFTKYYFGIDFSGSTSCSVSKSDFRDGTPNATAAGSSGIRFAGTNSTDNRLDTVTMDAAGGSMPTYGVLLQNCDATQLVNCDIIHHGNDLHISPDTGQSVAATYAINSYFDTANNGVYIAPTGTGTVLRAIFNGCWAGSHSNNGFTVTSAGSNTINMVQFIGCHGLLNTSRGLLIDVVSDVKVVGGFYSQNTVDGIAVGSGVEGFSIIGAQCRSNTAQGIYLVGSNDNYQIVGNDLRGNANAILGLVGNTSTKIIHSNLGINEVVLASQISALTADFTGSDVNTAQPVFSSAQDALTVLALTSYRFRASYVISRAAGVTSHTTGILFGGTATFTSIDAIARVSNPSGNVLGAASEIQITSATETVLTAADTSATENVRVTLEGVMRINAAGTVIPQFKYSAAPGGAPTVKRNSFFECWPIGSNTVAAVGGWA